MVGEISDPQTQQAFSPHFWIELTNGQIIDYRARMWLGEHEHIPNGIFSPQDTEVIYRGNQTAFENLDQIALLLMKFDCIDE